MIIAEDETLDDICEQAKRPKSAAQNTWSHVFEKIIWVNLIYVVVIHAGLVGSLIYYGLGLHSTPVKTWTILWAIGLGYVSFLGITAGVHRLWAHRTYKAALPLRAFLMILYGVLGLYNIQDWVRDHRVHHRYSETEADPHNARQGFFFAHIGWLMMKRTPECIRRSREVDLTDVKNDPVVLFDRKHQVAIRVLVCYAIPSVIPAIFWGETLLNGILTQCFIRHVLVLNFTAGVNSFAHLWGNRPYNKFINPAENLIVSLLTAGEGAHNYHHTFPWDYKAAELPYLKFNTTTLFIDIMAKLGLAYDLRAPSPELVQKVMERIGSKSETHKVH